MSTRYISEEEAKVFQQARQKVAAIDALLSEAFLLLLQSGFECAVEAAAVLTELEQKVSGFKYSVLTPQPEWLGGSIEQNLTRYRAPHALQNR